MTTSEVARRLGMVLSPTQELYRMYRRQGVSQPRARELARSGARSLAVEQVQTVLAFIRQHAVWIIPDEAWPTP